jgi:isopentenyl-diphosphate delta-isomerase
MTKQTRQQDPEHIVLLDEQYTPIGSAPKLASHHADTPLHLAFSCYVFNDAGELLVTRRALSKKVWPGVWSNSFCGHPAPSEAIEDAIERRALVELGVEKLRDLNCVLPDYRYTTPLFEGVIENEFCPVYVARLQHVVAPNPDEIGGHEYISWDEFRKRLVEQPDEYSYWAKEQAVLLDGYVRKNILQK